MLAPFSNKQREYYFRSLNSWFNVAEGGVRGGKNVLNVMAFCHAVEKNPNRLHLIMGPSVSSAQLNIVECDGFGILFHFAGRYREGHFKDRRCIYVETAYGEQKVILISGANNARSMRQIKGQTYGCVYVTEANECDPDTVKETFNRTMSSKVPKHFHDLNPKPDGNWYYKDILKNHETKQAESKDYGFNYGHFTVWDNLSITDEQLAREIAKHDKESARYKRDILGKRVALEGLVYSMFNTDFHVVAAEPRPYEKYWASCDIGHANATAFALVGQVGETRYVIDEYYHSGRDTGQSKTVTQYANELDKLIGNKTIESVVVDPSAAAFIAELRSRNRYRVRHGRNDVLPGIDAVINCLHEGSLKVNDCCTNMIKEFGAYRWDDKSPDDRPIKENDHMVDSLRYLVFTLGWGTKRQGFITI